MSDSLAQVQFGNMTTHSFRRDLIGLSTPTNVTSFVVPNTDMEAQLLAFSQSPSPTMAANTTETMAVDGTSLAMIPVEDIAQAEFEIYCVWLDEESRRRFGVKIHVPAQVVSIGTRPNWYVMSDAKPAGSDTEWLLPSNDPSTEYTWTQLPGLIIKAVPTSDHSSLTIFVNMKDIPLAPPASEMSDTGENHGSIPDRL